MKSNKLLSVIAALLVLTLFFLTMWCVSASKVTALRNDSAAAVAQTLKNYQLSVSDMDYRQSVGHMQTFLAAWEKLGGKGDAYTACCDIYEVMLRNPRAIFEYVEELVFVMDRLSDNIGSREALQELIRIGSVLSDK